MRNSITGVFWSSCGFAACIIGAGFASGQEIVSFFVKYGKISIIGILLSCIIFSLYMYSIMRICVKYDICSYNVILDRILPNKYIKKFVHISVMACSAMSVCVMTACSGEIAKLVWGIPNIAGAASFCLICMLIFFLNARKISDINSVLGAVIIFGIIFCCFYILRFREHQTASYTASVIISGVSYAGYNIIGAGAIIAQSSRRIYTQRDALISSILSGFILFVMITLIWGVLGMYHGKVNLGEVPMLTMAYRQNYILGIFYGIMLIAAVLTTGISNGFAVIDMLKDKISAKTSAAILMIIGFYLSSQGFSELINTGYRICGYVGAVISFIIIYYCIKIYKK